MCFNSNRILQIALAFAFLFGSGCSWLFPGNESPPPSKMQDFSSGTQCLSNATTSFKNFVLGTASENEISGLWDCMVTAMKTFKSSTRGRQANIYTAHEIASFFEYYYLSPDTKISDDLLVQLMKIKQIFVGGENDTVTSAELDRTITVFQTFKTVSLQLRPHMVILSTNWKLSGPGNIEADVKQFEGARSAIQSSAQTLGQLIAQNNVSYNLDDVVVLLQDLSTLYHENWSVVGTVQTYLPIVKKLKTALAGGQEASVSPSEWTSFLQLGGRGYMEYLRHYYFVADASSLGGAAYLAYLTRTLDGVFSLMEDLVSSKPSREVTQQELYDILVEVGKIWTDFKMSQPLLTEIMKIKKLMMGGSASSWAKDDFEIAREKLARLHTITDDILPYISLIALEWKPTGNYDEDFAYVQNGRTQFVHFVSEFSSLLSTDNGDGSSVVYDLLNVNTIVTEIHKLYPNENIFLSQKFQLYLPMVIDVKHIVFSDNISLVLKSQWGRFLSTVGDVYSNYIFYNYMLSGQALTTPNGVTGVTVFGNGIISCLKNILNQKDAQFIPENELGSLLLHVRDAGIITQDIHPETLLKVLSVILNQILVQPEQRTSNIVIQGLNMDSVAVLAKEISYWVEAQSAIEKVFGSDVNKKIPADVLRKQFADLARGVTLDARSTATREMAAILNTNTPLTLDDDGKWYLAHQGIPYSKASLDAMNWRRAIVRLIIRSYTGSLDRVYSYTGITNEEANKVFADFRDLAIQINWLDPDNTTFANSRFREGNLFGPRSNGDSYLGFIEGNDYMAMLFSGVKIANQMKEEVLKNCPFQDIKNGRDKAVPLVCIRNQYLQLIPKYMSSMPEQVAYVQKLTQAATAQDVDLGSSAWQIYITDIFEAAGYIPVPNTPDDKQMVALGDFSLAPHAMQYIESIVYRYDVDRDGIIDTQELVNAYPTFKNILLSLPQVKQYGFLFKSDSQLLGLLSYFVRYQKEPTLKTMPYFLWWQSSITAKQREKNWHIRADRKTFASVLSFIAAATRPAPSSVSIEQSVKKVRGAAGQAVDYLKDETRKWLIDADDAIENLVDF